MRFKTLLEDLLVEASKKDVLIQKLGLDESSADAIYNVAGPFSVFIANKIIDSFMTRGDQPRTRDEVVNELNVMGTFRNPLMIRRIRSIVDWFRVGLNNNFKPYQNLDFGELGTKSEEWHDSLNVGDSDLNYKEKHPIILDFRNDDGVGMYWVDLETRNCSEEAKRMGHCGTSAGNLYSLRQTVPVPNVPNITKNISLVTASIDDNGVILQMKGPRNKKPNHDLHKYIIPLILSDLVQNFGSEYASEEDFSITDLPESQIKQIYHEKPELFNNRKLRRLLTKMGYDVAMVRDNMSFELEIDASDVRYYVDGDWTVSTVKDNWGRKRDVGMFETMLSGDMWDIFEGSHDWKGSLDYLVDESNMKKIWELINHYSLKHEIDITDMSVADALEECDVNYEIRNAIGDATSDGESDATYIYYMRQLREALETYGDLLQLNDDGARIVIDLNEYCNKIGVSEDDLDSYFENCEDDLYCVFNEILGAYRDKPDFNIDSRWSPDIDERNFNNILDDRLNDIYLT
jgi:hypothetical protein